MSYLSSIFDATPTVGQVALCIGLTVVFSIVFAIVYNLIKRREMFHKDMPITFVIFPIVVCVFVLLVSYLAVTFEGTAAEAKYSRAIVALFACVILIKFRSQQRNTEDLTYLFFLTAIGFLMGLGYIWIALTLYAVVVLLVVLMYALGFPRISSYYQNLKITIPEDLNYEHAFDDIFENFTDSHVLTKVKSSDMGTMFVLNYEVKLKKNVSQKDMIDQIRTRNGNLNVVLTLKKFFDSDLSK